MESRWWLSVMGGVLSFVALGIPSHAMAGGEDGVSTDTKQEDETPEWARKLYGEPPEFKVFEVAGHRFRVPRDYSRQSSEEDPSFQMSVLWPTLDPYWTDKPQPRDREDFDTLLVTVDTFDDYDYRLSLIDRRIKSTKEAIASGRGVERIGSLVRKKRSQVYLHFSRLMIGEVEQPIQIVCVSDHCRISCMPFTKVEVEIQFDKVLLADWDSVVGRIVGLLENYKEE